MCRGLFPSKPRNEVNVHDCYQPGGACLYTCLLYTSYQPIPLIEEGEYSVIQEETGAENVIHVTTESVDMKSSTCENQDCVKQGVVSLDNRDSRLLGNMIICLPNQVTLELYTTEELIQMLSGT